VLAHGPLLHPGKEAEPREQERGEEGDQRKRRAAQERERGNHEQQKKLAKKALTARIRDPRCGCSYISCSSREVGPYSSAARSVGGCRFNIPSHRPLQHEDSDRLPLRHIDWVSFVSNSTERDRGM
jgi:hypothetical protein